MSALRLFVVTAAVALLGAPAAVAHVQVSPGEAAPDDAVRFEVLVPNEDDKATVEVDLQVPPGVLPFSYEDTPGWKRELQTASNGSVEVIRWTGRVEPEGFVRFSFLAATPPQPGTIAWKALQTYEGGEVVRWIGDEGSEYPAAFTEVFASAVEDQRRRRRGAQWPQKRRRPSRPQQSVGRHCIVGGLGPRRPGPRPRDRRARCSASVAVALSLRRRA